MNNLSIIIVTLLYIGTDYLASGQEEYAPIVQLTRGKVRGLVVQDDANKKLHLYQGIRYGRAERFSKPRPVESWTDVYNATTDRDACPQPLMDAAASIIQGKSHSEDCLYVNVWRPIEERINRSVMVWIHGGGFTIGTIFSMANDARYFSSQGDVVVVAINYRLGPFGFLYGNTTDAPGNLGLHDQILALRWVQENIHSFGGDPHKVTVFGESAGSISIGSLILSPVTKGLFHRAIMQSGAPLSTESTTRALERTKSLALKLKCPIDTQASLISCLRSKTVDELVNHTKLDFANNDYYKPINNDELLPILPVEALKSGKFNHDIDLLYGVTQNEGSYFTLNMLPKYKEKSTNVTIESARQDIVQVMKSYKVTFGEEVAQFYLANLTSSSTQDDLKVAVASAIGDHHITCPTILFAEQLAKSSPNAHYFSYQFAQRFPISVNGNQAWTGVTHAEDVLFLFLVPFLGTAENKQLTHDMIQAWTSFAKSGRPGTMASVEWAEAFNPKVAHHDPSFMFLHANQYKMVNGYYQQTCDTFWKPKLI